MTNRDGRPQPFIGVGGVVGADKERAIGELSDKLKVSDSGRNLLVSVNATHAAQLEEKVDRYRHLDKNWNPQSAAEFQAALSSDTEDVTAMATVRFDGTFVSNPGYTDVFTTRVLQRASWADIIRFSGFNERDFQGSLQEDDPQTKYMKALFANTQEKAPDIAVAVDYPLPTLEQLREEGALQSVADQLAHYAKVLHYVVLTTREQSIQSARAVIERIYETPELDGVGIVVESKSPDTATNSRMTRLLGDFPDDLSVIAEESLHVTPSDPTRPVDVEAAIRTVQKALAAIEAGKQQQLVLEQSLQNHEK